MSYFSGATTLDAARERYRSLAKQHHPDRGGDTAIMQAINAEWETLSQRLSSAPALPPAPKYPPELIRDQEERRQTAMLARAQALCPEARVYTRGNHYYQHICIAIPADHPARDSLRANGYQRHSAWKCWRKAYTEFAEYDAFMAWLRGERGIPFSDSAELEVLS